MLSKIKKVVFAAVLLGLFIAGPATPTPSAHAGDCPTSTADHC